MSAFPIHPLAETPDSVTLSRADFEALTDLVADAADLADIDAVKRKISAGDTATFPFSLAERLLDGDHPVRVFREYRGFGLRELAAAAGIAPSYLSEIESGRKPGSLEVLRQLSAALGISADLLASNEPGGFPVVHGLGKCPRCGCASCSTNPRAGEHGGDVPVFCCGCGRATKMSTWASAI